ncbi:MAG: alpha/beta hydrolase [Gammaproteobacteria bacterium]
MYLPTTAALAVDITIGKPPGKMYDVGGYHLHMYCAGDKPPVIIIDTGLGSSAMEWLDIQDELQSEQRVCIYDRAGYGWSAHGPGPRTVDLLSEELFRLLNAAEVAPPYILVGHSFGGYVAQYFAETHPDSIAGMVLVESSHPQQSKMLKKAPLNKQMQVVNPISTDAIEKNTSNGYALDTPIAIGSYLNSRRKAIFSQMDELKHFTASGQLIIDNLPLPDVPLIVLGRGIRVWDNDNNEFTSEDEWQELQESLAEFTSKGEYRVARNSGHHIHLDEPEMVLEAIRDVMMQARLETGTKLAQPEIQ